MKKEEAKDILKLIRDNIETPIPEITKTGLAITALTGGIEALNHGIEKEQSVRRYFQLMQERPEEFQNTGLINIEKNFDKFIVAAQVLNKPVGVVYESNYHLMVVDICLGKDGYYTYERIIPKTQGNAVVILPEYKGKVILLKQYRHALRDWQYAIPRGFANDELSEKDNAIKNVVEKTGCTVSNLTCLGTTVADSGLSGTKVTVYHAKCSEPDFKYGTGNATQLVMMSLGELREMIHDGRVTDGFTMTALMMYMAAKNE